MSYLFAGSWAAALSTSAAANTFTFDKATAKDVAAAVGPAVGVSVRVCDDKPVQGRFTIRTPAELRDVFGAAGMPVDEPAPGQMTVGCDKADLVLADRTREAFVPAPFQPQLGSTAPAPSLPPVKQSTVVIGAKWVPRSLLRNIGSVLGVRVLVDDIPDVPVLIAGPADVVEEARRYIRAANVCPAQLQFEATVIEEARTAARERGVGVRLGGRRIGLGTAGTSPDTGITLPWLTAYLDATKGRTEARANSTVSSLLMVGQKATIQDGLSLPVRTGTAITDRESRTDIAYRNAGHSAVVQLLAVDGGQALLSIDHNYSSVSGTTDLGPTFAERHVTAVMRVPSAGVTMLALAGADTAEAVDQAGILSRRKGFSARKGGVYLAFKLTPIGCGGSELASDDASRSTAANVRR